MSSTGAEAEEEADEMMCCAGCGKAEVDDIKLRTCTACKSVRYCGIQCQRDHRPQHKRECKKRADELRDEILFRQPESSNLGDCPICCLPLSIDPKKFAMYSCCSKLICDGCVYANDMRELEQRLVPKCPFCRHPTPKTEDEGDKNRMKRIEANDPVAICDMGKEHYDEGDYEAAFEYLSKAAELGDVEAHFNLSFMYEEGTGVEKDEKKQVHHLEEAAIGGHPGARHNLGCVEGNNGRQERAAKHWIIAAKLGDDVSLENLKKLYAAGIVNKEDFATALRAHQAAIDATKSPQREAAAEWKRVRNRG
jgi:tetratricopeptide (TPR) repeat protein